MEQRQLMDMENAAAHWVEHGFVVLPGFFDAADLAAARAGFGAMFPTADGYHASPNAERHARYRDDEYGGLTAFPFESTEVCLLSVHPRLVALAESILETDDIRLYAAEAWAKFTGAAQYEQALHRDFFNHTPVVPSDDPRFRQLEMFVYLSDVTDAHGAIHLVPRRFTQHLPIFPHAYSRDEAPDLYAAEVSGAGPAGTVVAYSVDTFHRATAMTAPRGARYTLMANFRRAANEWMTRQSWGDASFSPAWYPFIARATLRQLLLFGIPPPGHPFWTDETLAAMAVRYPSLDLSPWLGARSGGA